MVPLGGVSWVAPMSLDATVSLHLNRVATQGVAHKRPG